MSVCVSRWTPRARSRGDNLQVVVSQGTPLPVPEGAFAPYELVRELGARPVHAYAVRQASAPGAKTHLFVAERFPGAALGPDGKDSDFLREAKRIATLTSPNLPRVRDVAVRGEDLVAYTELVDGEKLAALWRPDGLPLEIALRVLVDVLSGVATLHNLRDARQQPLKLAHGELSPATIVFGLDGVARILHAVARRSPGVLPDPGSVRTMAPEVLTGRPYDQRADVYSVGALLWEALCGKPLFADADPLVAAARVGGGEVPRATVPAGAAWAKDLVEVAARALSLSPDGRWANATVMAGELRKAAGLRLAPVSTTAAFAKTAIAERVKARRQALETQAPMQPSPASRAPAPPIAAPPRVEAPAASPPPPATDATPDEDVLVAPGIRAPVAEVFELGSDALLETSDSGPPPPPAPPARAALDPFSLSDARRAPPPAPPAAPPPPAFVAPVVPVPPALELEPAPPDPAVPSAPQAAFDAELAPVAAAADPLPAREVLEERRPMMETAPSLVRIGERDEATRRRKVLVLGGVGALGSLILVLALVRWVTRDTGAHAAPSAPVAAHVAPPVASQAASPAVAPPPSSPVANIAPAPPPQSVASPATATAQSAPPPSSPAPTPVAAAAPPAAAAARPKATPAPRPAATPRPKKRKPAFDPNTL